MNRALMLALFCLASCAQILDIEERKLISIDGGVDAEVLGTDASAAIGSDGSAANGSAGCDEYCDLAQELCTKDTKAQLFQKRETCMAVCAKYTVDSTTTRNTLTCRLNLLRGLKATGSNEALTTCPGAGPGGGPPPMEPNGVNCGTDCEGFCALRAATCPVMAGDVGCVDKCRALENSDVYNADRDFGGGQDSLSCRIAHLSAAAYYDATEMPNAMGKKATRDAHCSHSGIRSEVQCDFPKDNAPDCKSYCKIVGTACTGDKLIFESNDQCLHACEFMIAGTPEDITATGSKRCYRAGAYDALEGQTNGCPRASIAGDGCVGGRCASYCFFAQKACPDAFKAKYPTDTQQECISNCSAPGVIGAASNTPYSLMLDIAQSGDNLVCKLKQLTRAMGDTTNVPAKCSAALGLASPCL